MDWKTQKLCACSGFAVVIVFMTGFWLIAGFIPPPSPSLDAAQIGDYFRANSTGIRVGMVVAMFGAGLTGPWVAAMTFQLKRIEGWSVLVLTQFALGTLLVLEFIIFLIFWEVAAFRPDRSNDSIQLFNDLAWVGFIGLTSTAIIQLSVFAAIILRDKSERPILPRWAAYANIWIALAFTPGGWNCLFHGGPIAWNGILSFWIAMFAFLSWFVVNAYVCLRAVRRHERETLAAGDLGGGRPANVDVEQLALEVAELRREIARDRAAAG